MLKRLGVFGFVLLFTLFESGAVLALGAADACSWKANFMLTGALPAPKAGHVATVLQDRSVLVSGGSTPQTTVNTAARFNPNTGQFTPTGNLLTARYFHTATLLPSGKVLIAGGSFGAGSGGALASTELFDPATNTFSAAGNLLQARVDHSATLLRDGRVLLVGGSAPSNVGSTAVAQIELYDPATNTSQVIGSLATPRSYHSATLLPRTASGNDDILIVGGNTLSGPTASVERLSYNPSSRALTVSAAPGLNEARMIHTATLMADGEVLVIGGADRNYKALASAELWNGAAFSLVGALSHARDNHFATLLPTGQVLVAGGLDVQVIAPAELYTPGAGFRDIGDMVAPRFYAAAAELPQGQVLFVGGFDASQLNTLANAEIYDPFWAGVGPMHEGRANHSATLLNDGRVLLAGGSNGQGGSRSSAEVFDPVSLRFTQINMLANREKHTATLLTTGEVLLTGGQSAVGQFLTSSELFDPIHNSFAATGALSVPRLEHTATLLADGRVLVAGGFGPSGNWQSTEFFNRNVGNGSFSAGPNMTRDRRAHAALRLSNGQVLLSGGWSNAVSGITYALEQFDPASNAFTLLPNPSWMITNRMNHAMLPTTAPQPALVVGGLTSGIAPTASMETVPSGSQGQMQQARFLHALTAVGLNSKQFWVIGGQNVYNGSPLASVERIDAGNLATTTSLPELGAGRARHTATLLQDGRVLVAGGVRAMDGTTATAEISKSTLCQLRFPRPRPGKFSFEKVYLRVLPDAVALRVLVGNAGRINNPATEVRYALLAKQGAEQAIPVGTLRVPRLGPGEKVRLSSRFALPPRLPAGEYRIRACVQARTNLPGACFEVPENLHRAAPRSLRKTQFPLLGDAGR